MLLNALVGLIRIFRVIVKEPFLEVYVFGFVTWYTIRARGFSYNTKENHENANCTEQLQMLNAWMM